LTEAAEKRGFASAGISGQKQAEPVFLIDRRDLARSLTIWLDAKKQISSDTLSLKTGATNDRDLSIPSRARKQAVEAGGFLIGNQLKVQTRV